MASTELQPPPQPLKHKTCVLRVSIHCEGCKRKVNKLLKSIPGVDDVQIDRQLQRAVVTGDVSPESLLRKLVKSGKHAELWPENPPPIQTRKTEKLASNSIESVASKPEIKPPETKTEAPPVDSSKAADPAATKAKTEAPAANGGVKVNEAAAEVKPEEKKPETGSPEKEASPAAVEKKEQKTENEGGVVGGGSGGGGGGGEGKVKRKKKKEGQNGNKSVTGEASTSTQPPPEAVTNTVKSANQSLPRHHGFDYASPQHHTPVYTVSYNTAHPPVNSYTASYYAAGPPPQAYAYSHYASEMAPPPVSGLSGYEQYTQQPADSFEMFSDENPNGCLVM